MDYPLACSYAFLSLGLQFDILQKRAYMDETPISLSMYIHILEFT